MPGWAYPQTVYTDIYSYLRENVKKRKTFTDLREEYSFDPLNIFSNGYLRHIFEIDSRLSDDEIVATTLGAGSGGGGGDDNGGANAGVNKKESLSAVIVIVLIHKLLNAFIL